MLCFIARQFMIMDNQNNHVNTFINNQNFTETNNLTYLLGNDDTTEEITRVKLSPYLDTQELCEKLHAVKSNLSIISLNAQCIRAKFDDFQIAMNEINKKCHVSIVCIQESWLSSECCTKMFELPDYQLISKGKYCSNHGGLLIYVHNDYYCEPITIKEDTIGWENLFVKVRHKSTGSKANIIGNIYRVPKELLSDFHLFQEEFDEALELLRTIRSPIYLCGDYNIDLLKINTKDHYNTFYNNLTAAGYLPRISLPTRITNHSATLIDNIFSTELCNNDSAVIVNHISDHQMICTYSTDTDKNYYAPRKRFIEIEKNDQQTLEKFLNKLKNSNITNLLNLDENADPNLNFDLFMKHFMNLKQECFQRKLVRFDKKKHRINPWLTSGILKSINYKDKLYKTLMQTSKDSIDYPVLLSNFKVYKNIIRRSIMLAKRDYYRNAFNRYSTNMKKTWQTISQTLNRRKRDRDFPQEFKLANGNTISEPKKIANAFNDFFIGIGDGGVSNESTNNDFNRYMPSKANCTLMFEPITVDTISRIISGLKPKTSTGIDNISNKLLKFVKNVISEPLSIIINQMLKLGIFPDLLKISKVVPLYKKDDDSNLSNYRPISLLPSISKIFEKVLLEQLTTYLDNNNLIHNHQYGFRKRHSTEYAALHIVDYLNYEMDLKRTPINLYLDLSKAFDSLSHKILISKLKHYGICDIALKLMKSYLENRKQYVQFDTCTSDMKSIRNGVPQGSILGPLLFLIYINDFPNSSKLFNFLMYADDTTLFCCLEDIKSDNKELVLNNELQRVHSWLKANRLSLNVKKTKYMLFRKQKRTDIRELNLRISNDAIQPVDDFNFLGLHINSKLNWETHTNVISKRMSRAVGVIKKLQLVFPKTILLTIYNALILPHINYCLLSWGSASAVKTIFTIQKRAIRAISSAGYNAHTEPLFKFFNVLKVEDIYNYRLLVLYYNLKHKNVPYHIASFLPKTSIARERYPIRKSRLQPPLHAHEYITKTCKYRLPVFLNSINNNSENSDILRNIIDEINNITLVKFKSVTKRYMINKYSYYCNIRNCYICQL